MSELPLRLLPLVEQARGRCHSCANQKTYDLPVSGPLFYCRAYAAEYRQEARDAVRDCPRWAPFRPTDSAGRVARASRNPLFAQLIEAEDHMFWQLKMRLRELGIDLKTVLVLTQPALRSGEQLAWVDGLEARFGDELPLDAATLAEIVDELRALRYNIQVCDVLTALIVKVDGRSQDAPRTQ